MELLREIFFFFFFFFLDFSGVRKNNSVLATQQLVFHCLE